MVVGTAYNCTLLLGSRSAAEQNAKQKFHNIQNRLMIAAG